MKTPLITLVIAALISEVNPKAQFNELLQLFMKHPEHNYGQARFLNRAGFSKVNLENLKYDIQKLYGIRANDLLKSVSKKKVASKKIDKKPENKQSEALQKIFTEAPDDVKGGMKLRDRYPFLNAEDCPDKLKVLTSDMITAFNKYMGAREEIQQMVADGKEAELFEMAKVAVENFELNKEIQDELDHYQEHGEILGNHLIFADEMLQQKVATYKTADLKSKRGNIRSYVTKENKKLALAKTEESKAIIQSKIDGHLAHIALIEARLGSDGEK